MPNQDRLDDSKWNLISFHIRGAGCSQIPLDHSYDIYINSISEMNDIEAVRKDLRIVSWDLVIGESFGSWLAQQYANKNPNSLKHLYLEGIYNPAWLNAGNYTDALGDQIIKDVLISIASRDNTLFSPALSPAEIQSISSKVAPLLTQFDGGNYDVPESLGSEFVNGVSMATYVGTLAISPVLNAEQDAVIVSVLNPFFPNRVNSTLLRTANQKISEGFSFESSSQKMYPGLSGRVNASFQKELSSVTQINVQNIPTIYVDGTLDGDTPIAGAEDMAKKSCGSSCIFVTTKVADTREVI